MTVKAAMFAAILTGAVAMSSSSALRAAEFGANTPYYEDDALLDITEWFEGNDYNPTDEAWWRWDDETYQARQDTSGDSDSDWYGYSTRDDNDWYYDYYDPYAYDYYDYDDNDLYDFGTRYYDYDNDGTYDAMASYSDWDNDGIYDDYDYYSFTNLGTEKQQKQAKDAAAKESRQQQVTGKVQKTKMVKVRGGKQHVVVAIEPQQGQQGEPIIVDLGRAEDLKDVNPKLGDTITAKGPRAKVGEKSVLLAGSIEVNGKTTQINRTGRTFSGKVLNTHKAKVRNQQHQMAIIEAQRQGKTQKIAVDLDPADRLKMDIKGETLTFTGYPVKVKDRVPVVARSVQQGEQIAQINRQPQQAGQAQPAASEEKAGQGQSQKEQRQGVQNRQ